MDYSPAKYRSQSPIQLTPQAASVPLQSPAFTICAVDQSRLYAEIDKVVEEEYLRVKKLHQDPRKEERKLSFEEYTEVEKSVKGLMETYVRKRFPGEMGHRKPFEVWKELKDAEDLIRTKILQQHNAQIQAMRDRQQQEAKLSRAKSKDAIRVISTQHWKAHKNRQQKQLKHSEREKQENQESSAHVKQAKAKEEYMAWLMRKVVQSRETALNQRKERLIQQQMKADQELKAQERAESSYQQWLARKHYESMQRSRESPLRKEDSQRSRSRPVLMAYSANRKGLSKELWTELSAYVDRQGESYGSSRSGTASRGKRLAREEDVLESDLGSSGVLQPARLHPQLEDQSDSAENYEYDYEEEEEEYEQPKRPTSGLERRQAMAAFEYPVGPQREVTFQDRARNQAKPQAQWADEGSSLGSEEGEEVGFVEGSDYSLEENSI